MVKHIIWTSDIGNLEDWEEGLKETCEINDMDYESMTESDRFYMAVDINNDYLSDERMNLDVIIPEGIVAIADIGRWNGRCSGYKEVGNSITDCLYSDSDDSEWYVDEHGVMHSIQADHDGTTYVVYKAWKEGVSELQQEKVLDAIYEQRATESLLSRYMRNIGGDVAKVYGWRVATGRKGKTYGDT